MQILTDFGLKKHIKYIVPQLDVDEMIALAKRTPTRTLTSLGAALNKHPKQVADFLRLAPKLTKEQMDKLLIKGNDFLASVIVSLVPTPELSGKPVTADFIDIGSPRTGETMTEAIFSI